MKKLLSLILAAMLSLSLGGYGISADNSENSFVAAESETSQQEETSQEEATGETLADWKNDAGWTAFYTFTQNPDLDDAYEAAAEAFAPAIGMDDLDGEGLKALQIQAAGFEDDISSFTFTDDSMTALDSEGDKVFSYQYSFVETIENAIEGENAYIYKTDNAGAEEFTYLCLTLPNIATEEGGVIQSFNIRHAADDYEALATDTYEGSAGVVIDADAPIEDVDYTIRVVYGAQEPNR